MERQVVSEYRGSVYEQTVRIRLIDGTELNLFDGRVSVGSELVGETGAFVVLVIPETFEISIGAEELGIFPAENPSSDWSYEFRGEMRSIDTEDHWFDRPHENLLTLDIGYGEVLVKSTQSIRGMILDGRLSEGTRVSVSSTRTDLIEFHSEDF